jgi:hypothetical protein
MAAQGNLQKETIIKQLHLREQQRNTARRIKHLRGRLTHTATTTVTIKDKSGVNIDISDKKEMEKAIINTNKKKNPTIFSDRLLQISLQQTIRLSRPNNLFSNGTQRNFSTSCKRIPSYGEFFNAT